MKKQFERLVVIGFIFYATCAGAVTDILPGNNNDAFNVSEAYQKVESQKAILESEVNENGTLYDAAQVIKDLQKDAEMCVEKREAKFKKNKDTLDKMKEVELADFNSPDKVYLEKKQRALANEISDCRLFIFKSTDLLKQYENKLATVTAANNFKKTVPIWDLIDRPLFEKFNIDIHGLHSETDADGLISQRGVLALVLALLSLSAGYAITNAILLSKDAIDLNPDKIVYFTSTIKKFLPQLIAVALFALCLHGLLLSAHTTPAVVILMYFILGYVVLASVGKFVIHYPYEKPLKSNVIVQYKKFYKRLMIVLGVVLTGLVYGYFIKQNIQPDAANKLLNTFYMTVLAFSGLSLGWVFFSLDYFKNHWYPIFLALAKGLLFFTFITLLAFEWFGYHHISDYMIDAITVTFVLLTAVILIHKAIVVAFDHIINYQYKISRRLRYLIGLKHYQTFYEGYLFKVLTLICFYFYALTLLMQIWRVPIIYIDDFKQGFLEGVEIFGLNVVPLQIVEGALVYAILFILGRMVAHNISSRDAFKASSDDQNVFASIIIYISFAIAFLMGLLVAGVNFTGLAIIAGALSVGIGFGLQNLANNFICGIILLVQTPLKPGDRVVVDNVEGYIKKIRVLSTQIQTLRKEDVIIPNSDLITHPVTNLMFRDTLCRIVNQVGVEYGSDIDLVDKVLKEVAAEHPRVLKSVNNEPRVLFQSFGDSSLVFELWCIIDDVNQKYNVMSDLNFAIDKAFRAHNITIAFPQLDIHFDQPPKPTPAT